MSKKATSTQAKNQAKPESTEPEANQVPDVPAQLAGVQLQDGTVVDLKELPEADLRKLGADMEIAGADSLSIDDLVAAIKAEPVLPIDETEQPTASQAPSGAAPAVDGAGGFAGQDAQPDANAAAAPAADTATPARAEPEVHMGRADVLARGELFIVNRERLDHDDESYGFGDEIHLPDGKAAAALLGLGAIKRVYN